MINLHFLVGIICFLSHTPLLYSVERIYMQSGEMYDLQLSEIQSISLSRKGVVEIIEGIEGKFHILATRKGLVVVRILNEYEELDNQIIFEVNGANELESTHNIFSKSSEWFTFICGRINIECLFDRYSISGSSDDPYWFYQSESQCRKNQPCIFKVSLSDKGRNRLSEYFLNILSHKPQLSISPNGLIVFHGACEPGSKKKVENVKTFFNIPDYLLVSKCHHDKKMFEATLDIMTQVKNKGDVLRPWFSIDRTLSFIDSVRRSEISRDGSEVRVIGSPKFLLPVGIETEISDGSSNSEEEGVSSQYFRIFVQASIIEIVNQKAFMKLKIVISKPGDNYFSRSSSQFQGSVWVPIGRKIRISNFLTSTRTHSQRKHGILSKIPIVSPIFSQRSNQEGQVEMMIELTLKMADS